MDRKSYKNLVTFVLVISFAPLLRAQNIKPIVGLGYSNFYTVFHTISSDLGVNYKNMFDVTLVHNYNWYFNRPASKYYNVKLNFNSIGLKTSYRPFKKALSPRFEMSCDRGISKNSNGPILAYSGFPITSSDTSAYSYLGKFESLRWSFKLGGGLDYSWRNINVYLGMGYQWWEFNINRDFYHAYFTVGHRGLYYNARIAYRFGKKDKQE
jgi:hypothetical protein